MKTNIIFYLSLLIVLVGSIKFTTWSIHKRRLDKVNTSNHHEVISKALIGSGKIKKEQLQGKTLVVYAYNTFDNDTSVTYFPALNQLAAEHGSDVQFIGITGNSAENEKNHDPKLKIDFPVLYEDNSLVIYMATIANTISNDEDAIEKQNDGNAFPIALVISKDGKIKEASLGRKENPVEAIKKGLN